MTQTTLIGGLGLSVFAFSSFTPTHRFGTMMLTLLAAALVGDLLFLPALLASPIGKFFSSENQSRRVTVYHVEPQRTTFCAGAEAHKKSRSRSHAQRQNG